MTQPYADFVREFEALLARAERLPRGGPAPAARPAPKAGAPLALILAPHPDDECIVGALPLRLQREAGWRVGVVPMTLGSLAERHAGRLEELRGACAFLGWDVLSIEEDGLAEVMRRERPGLVLFPHAEDANSTHRRVHGLALEALGALGPDFRCAVAETEYWATLPDPNLMVEAPAAAAGDLVAALSFHKGEIERNPYHVLLPCWLADGARRGAELVGGQGSTAPAFRLASLYRLSIWNGSALERAAAPGRVAAAGADLSVIVGP
ncbi:MAG: PIG-L family deacetylase [Elusimicrobiota bacterium]|nr:PIG-L family deacetylase [Elusimicrobiota bacterium]